MVCDSLIAYFDKFINSRLLYSSELLQLKAFLLDNAVDSLSTVYGADHLLRLLCSPFLKQLRDRSVSLFGVPYRFEGG